RVKLDVAVGPRGQGVGAGGELVALAQWVVGDALERLRFRRAGQPDDPRRGRLAGQGGKVANSCRGRVAAANHENGAIRVLGAPLAENVFEPSRDLWPGGQLADRRNTAVAQRARFAVGARAIEN